MFSHHHDSIYSLFVSYNEKPNVDLGEAIVDMEPKLNHTMVKLITKPIQRQKHDHSFICTQQKYIATFLAKSKGWMNV
jgi:hypothetical protein